MSNLTDAPNVLAALETLKDWAKILKAPKRLDSLEQRVAALEALQGESLSRIFCAECGSAEVTRTGSREHPDMPELAPRETEFTCTNCDAVSYISQD